MQTIRIPYATDEAGRDLIASLRRVQSAAVRSAYANAEGNTEKDLRQLVKARFGTRILDSWALHCATRIGRSQRQQVPDGTLVFGSKANLERRCKGLIDRNEWRRLRLPPFTSYGDRQKARGNQNVHLLSDRTLVLKIGRRSNGRSGAVTLDAARLHLTTMTGNAGEVMRQLAQICAEPLEQNRINVSYAIDERFVSITFDPEDLPDHPERRTPVQPRKGRALGIDLNPNWIGMAVIDNTTDPSVLSETELLDHQLVELGLPAGATAEQMRETLARVCDRAVRMARHQHCGVIALESGLGKLRSGGKNRSLNRLLNYWARTLFVAMLRRKAKLAGIGVVEVWGGYSSTIGNLAFEAPDACAAAAEIARRGLARSCGIKELLPAFEIEVGPGRWKDQGLPTAAGDLLRRARSWGDVHRAIKSAKLGVRRPHPRRAVGPDGRGDTLLGHAVHRLGLRHRPGWIFRVPAQLQGMKTPGSVSGLSTLKSG